MLALSPHLVIHVATQPVDFRRGIDGLIGVCRQQLSQEPLEGALFLFRNRAKTSIKGLCFDGQGFWLFTKRLSSGTFRWWPSREGVSDYRAVQVLLNNGNPEHAQFSKDWRPLP
jgi:transposase